MRVSLLCLRVYRGPFQQFLKTFRPLSHLVGAIDQRRPIMGCNNNKKRKQLGLCVALFVRLRSPRALSGALYIQLKAPIGTHCFGTAHVEQTIVK